MSLLTQYNWLEKESGPLMILEALKLFGTLEQKGKANNQTIIAWAKEIGGNVADVYKADEIPWCGLFMAVVAKRAKKQVVKDPLWALNWGTFGKQIDNPEFGDVLVFIRKTSEGKTAGHVGLYIGEDKDCYHVLGGNQSDQVCIARIQKSRLYASRRPNYNVQPKNVRRVFLKNSGTVSVDEQ
ncbi:MAG: TIGR02594 family protein [Bacteriodetes bacterium]|nr:TIGR02594 family protein [Bacteroidota bacterium]